SVDKYKVTRNGIWVTTIAKMRAGSSGARRLHFSDGLTFLRAGAPGGTVTAVEPVSTTCVTWDLPMGRGPAVVRRRVPALSLVLLGHVFGELLPVGQGFVHCGASGNGGGYFLGHLGAEILELRYADELDAQRRSRLQARVGRVGLLDRLQRQVGE